MVPVKDKPFIVFVWSQYDGPNIKQYREMKLKIVEGDLHGSNQQDLDPTIPFITSVIVP